MAEVQMVLVYREWECTWRIKHSLPLAPSYLMNAAPSHIFQARDGLLTMIMQWTGKGGELEGYLLHSIGIFECDPDLAGIVLVKDHDSNNYHSSSITLPEPESTRNNSVTHNGGYSGQTNGARSPGFVYVSTGGSTANNGSGSGTFTPTSS